MNKSQEGLLAVVPKSKVAEDVAAVLFNVVSSVLIIMVNKHLMGRTGYNYHYGISLCALHFMACGLYTTCMVQLGVIKRVKIPWRGLWSFAGLAAVSIASLNLSLMFNTVGLYQISKLLIIPFIAVIECLWYARRFGVKIISAMACVVAGVAILTVDGEIGGARSFVGLGMAALSVASTGMQQLLCRDVQKSNNVSSQELLAASSPVQALILLVVGPPLDKMLIGSWVTEYNYSISSASWIALSSIIAVAVNLSQFLMLGRFTAVTFSVMGHIKTVLVLSGGIFLFHEPTSLKQLAAMALAVGGMVWYGMESMKPIPPAPVLPNMHKGKHVGAEDEQIEDAAIAKDSKARPSVKQATL